VCSLHDLERNSVNLQLAYAWSPIVALGGTVPLFARETTRHCLGEHTYHLRGPGERLVFYCRTTSASTAPRTPRRTCCPYVHVLITVLRASRPCELFPDGFDLHLQRPRREGPSSARIFSVLVKTGFPLPWFMNSTKTKTQTSKFKPQTPKRQTQPPHLKPQTPNHKLLT